MEIKVLGTGCAKCDKLYNLVEEVVEEHGIEANINKVTDIKEITGSGVMITPALMINDEVKLSGKLPSKEELVQLING